MEKERHHTTSSAPSLTLTPAGPLSAIEVPLAASFPVAVSVTLLPLTVTSLSLCSARLPAALIVRSPADSIVIDLLAVSIVILWPPERSTIEICSAPLVSSSTITWPLLDFQVRLSGLPALGGGSA